MEQRKKSLETIFELRTIESMAQCNSFIGHIAKGCINFKSREIMAPKIQCAKHNEYSDFQRIEQNV